VEQGYEGCDEGIEVMRKLFIVLAKLMGFLQFGWALINVVQIGIGLSQIYKLTTGNGFTEVLVGLLGIGIYFILSIGMAWMLVFRTAWLADKLSLHDEGEVGGESVGSLYKTGLKLIGVYVTVYAIPALAKTVLTQSLLVSGLLTVDYWVRVLPPVLQLAVGVFIVIRTDRLLDLIAKLEKFESRHVLQLALGILAGIILVGLAVTSIRIRERNKSSDSIRSVVDRKSGNEGAQFIHKETNASNSAMYETPYWQKQTAHTNTETVQVIRL